MAQVTRRVLTKTEFTTTTTTAASGVCHSQVPHPGHEFGHGRELVALVVQTGLGAHQVHAMRLPSFLYALAVEKDCDDGLFLGPRSRLGGGGGAAGGVFAFGPSTIGDVLDETLFCGPTRPPWPRNCSTVDSRTGDRERPGSRGRCVCNARNTVVGHTRCRRSAGGPSRRWENEWRAVRGTEGQRNGDGNGGTVRWRRLGHGGWQSLSSPFVGSSNT